jgi:hypothetical protein
MEGLGCIENCGFMPAERICQSLSYFLGPFSPYTNCYDISLLRGWLVAGLPLICIKGGALGYKAVGRAYIHDSIIIIINTVNSNLMFNSSACKS